jgi:hypothetical protein
MEEQEITRMLTTRRLILNWSQTILHYFLPIILLIMNAIFVYGIFISPWGISKPFKFEFFGVTSTMNLLLFIYQSRALKFTQVATELDHEVVMKLIKKSEQENNWIPILSDSKLYVAKIRPSFSFGNFDEQITIIIQPGFVLFNSIGDPDKNPSLSSLGRNKKPLRSFERNINEYKTATNIT